MSSRGLFRLLVTHPVAVIMVSLAVAVFGFVSYQRLSVALMPDLSYPSLTVRTTYEGAAPGEVEAQVSRPIEEALATVDGLLSLQSRSRAGVSDVILGFDWGTDMDKVTQTVRESLQISLLPDGTDRPLLLHFDPSLDPILRVALAVPSDTAAQDTSAVLQTLRDVAERDVRRPLEAMDGVAAARIRGGLEAEIRVEVREDWLAARGVTLGQVRDALRNENVNLAGGSIHQGDTEYLVRTLNEYTSVPELEELGIRRADGVVIPLTDVALLSTTHKEATVLARLNGQPAVELEVFRSADSNIVDVATRVKAALADHSDDVQWDDSPAPPGIVDSLPEGVQIAILDDQAAFIQDAIQNLGDTALIGGLLAIVILFLFLRDFRATAIIGLAIPMSVIAAFAPLYLRAISLNLMSLGGLALGIGMLVDNAVVVLESIQRFREQGESRADAAVHGTAEVATAVTASTLTTVAVFLPISFVDGVAGQLFGDLAIAVVASLLASLVVALFLVPTLAAISWGDDIPTGHGGAVAAVTGDDPLGDLVHHVVAAPVGHLAEGLAWARAKAPRWPLVPYLLLRFVLELATAALTTGVALLGALSVWTLRLAWRWLIQPTAGVALRIADVFGAVYGRFAKLYASVLRGSLVRPAAVLTLSALAFALSVRAVPWLGSELIPEVHQGRFTIEAALPVGTPLSKTDAAVRAAERIVADHPDVASLYTAVGADVRADAKADEGAHSARLRVTLVPGGDVGAREERVAEELRVALAAATPELAVRIVRPSLFSVQTPLEVVLTGWDLGQLKSAGDEIVARLQGVPGLRDVRSSLVRGQPEILVRYDRQRLRRFGLDPATVAQQVRDKIQGTRATQIRQGDERVDLRVQLVEPDRSSLADLRSLNVNPNLVPPIPLDVVADVTEADGPSEIRRVDQQRAVVVGANVEGFDLGSSAAAVRAALADLPLPEDQHATVAGQSREMSASLSSLQFALLLAVFLVYVIMASAFESVTQPFIILFTVPLALIGVTLGLAVAGLPISVVVLIGAIVLAGVVVNNAIVLVDTVNRLRAEGLPPMAAVEQAATTRLRPILITTATTALGLLPLALGLGAGAEIQQPLAVSVIGGLVSSTLLTLLVIPVVTARLSGRTPTPSGPPA